MCQNINKVCVALCSSLSLECHVLFEWPQSEISLAMSRDNEQTMLLLRLTYLMTLDESWQVNGQIRFGNDNNNNINKGSRCQLWSIIQL